MEMNNNREQWNPGRRRFLWLVAGAAMALPLAATFTQTVRAGVKEVEEIIKNKFKNAPKEGRVKIIAPDFSENGSSVPITVEVESPMTEADHVKRVMVLAEGNPNPGIATLNFTPMMGNAKVDIKIRLAKAQKVVAVAEMSDGSVWRTSKEIKVSVGGC